ncbi:glucose 1-dehydrogenase [Candidatus Woesearchaeota archaeon]|nr:glucose 1-dehydrogenase [Candidatus Woesearchaeota archaeon]
MFDLNDKVAVVTGARRGIGKGIAEKLAEAGAKIVISDIDQEECDSAAAEIAERFSREAIGIKCDVSSKEEVDSLIQKTVERFGKLDILVNNAGIFFQKPLMDYTEEDWDKVLQVNLKGVYLCSQAAAREMIKNSYGKIVSVSSIAGIIGYPDAAAYCASKAGIINLTREMAIELAKHKINVNSVAPGLIETPMTQHIIEDQEQFQKTLAGIPWNRQGHPSDIANAVHYLVSDEADYVTGQTIVVDGGWTIQ